MPTRRIRVAIAVLLCWCACSSDGSPERVVKRFASASAQLDTAEIDAIAVLDQWPVIKRLKVIRSDGLDTLDQTTISEVRERSLDLLKEGRTFEEVHAAERFAAALLEKSAGITDRAAKFRLVQTSVSAEVEVLSTLGNPNRVAKFTLYRAIVSDTDSKWIVGAIE